MKHIDATYHVRGESQYVDDIPQPAEMLHAAVFTSPVARGKILALDTKAALSVEGVVAILTADDIPGDNQIGAILPDEPLLAKDEVCYVGQPVAVVVGKTRAIAQKAAKKITLEVAQQPPILDAREAFAKGEIIGTPRTFILGEVDSAWSKCDLIVEGTCEIGGQEHFYLETHRSRAVPLEGKMFRIYPSAQSPFAVQRKVAAVLGLPYHCIEVEVKRLGGGFGGKQEQAVASACMAALGARHTKKPVELVLSRQEDMNSTGKRHPYSCDFKIGVTSSGKILAYEVNYYQNAGAFADVSPEILGKTLMESTNAYFIPNVRLFGACCRTNLPSNTAMRGFGGPQAMFVIESAIAKVAEKLGMSREEIQYNNLHKEGDVFPYGQVMRNSRTHWTWDEAETTFNLPEIRDRIEQYNKTNFETKKGYAMMPICFGISFDTAFLNQASALVNVYTDGSVSISTGGVEMGQGFSTKIINIAAKAFGIRETRIKVESTNTTRIANMSPSAASVSTHLNGNATLLAIGQILDRLKSVAAKALGVTELEKIAICASPKGRRQGRTQQRFAIADEKVLYAGQETDWTWQRLVETAYFSRTALSAHAFYATPGLGYDYQQEKGSPFSYYAFGTAFFEITLDCLRGTYEIDAVKIVHDLGRSLNELIDRGQIEGGLAQGMGWMTIEDLRFNEKGELLSNTPSTYKVPDVFFMPDNIDIKFLENADNPLGPYGSKAIGEPPFMYGIGVFFAIRHAMRAFQPHKEFAFASPLTPERVLSQLYSEYLQEQEIAEQVSDTPKLQLSV